MRKTEIYSLESPYRDTLTVSGYCFGHGQKAACIVGSLRGNEVQQLYVCSQLVRKLQKLQNMQGSLPESMCFLHKPEEVYG